MGDFAWKSVKVAHMSYIDKYMCVISAPKKITIAIDGIRTFLDTRKL